jgi:diacylglycerol O-acyltransferase
MKRIGGMDAAFLSVETPSLLMHVCGLLVLDTSTMPEGEPYDHIHEMLARRLPHVEAVRRRLVPIPLNIGYRYWADDPDLDVDRHLHRISLGTPGEDRLAQVVSDIASTPLRRDRPLWEMWVIEGVAPDRIALLVKMHHSVIDGVGGANLMGNLFDLTPVPDGDAEEQPPRAPKLPHPGQVMCRTMRTAIGEPLALVSLVPRSIARVAGVAWQFIAQDSGANGAASPFSAPRVSFNAPVSKRRAVAFLDAPMADIIDIKHAFGVTVNDVVTAVVGGALRRYLAERGELPDRPLVAAEPVSVHGKIEDDHNNTQVSLMFASLGSDVEDPVERLEVVTAANKAAKVLQGSIGDDILLKWLDHAWLRGIGLGARLYSRLHLADHHPVIFSLILSNVSGPRTPMYLAGARLAGIYPLGPVMDGMGLNITVLSEEDRLGFGVVTCPELVPDVWRLAATLPEAVAELRAAASARTAVGEPSRSRSQSTAPMPHAVATS